MEQLQDYVETAGAMLLMHGMYLIIVMYQAMCTIINSYNSLTQSDCMCTH